MLVKNEKVFFPIDIVKSHAGDIYTSNAHMKKNTTNSTILIGKIIGRVFQRLSYPIGFIFGEIINVFSGNPHLWDKAKDSGCLFVSGFGKDPEEAEPGNAADEDGEQESAGSTDELRGRDSSEIQGDSGTEDDSPQADLPSRIDGLEEPDEEEGQTDQKEPLTREELLEHCADNTLKRYGEDEMVNLVELIINTIQPQAVEFIKNSFPAFAEAAKAGDLGKEIGLYIYRLYGDKDGVKAHADTSLQALAYVGYNISKDEQGKAEFGYIIGLNTIYFQYKDEDGNLHIDYSEQAAADLDNSIIHEMFHAFMLDYNRTGSIGTRNPEDYFRRSEDLQNIRDVYEFPAWFTEGMASAVENVYQYRYAYFQLLRYEGNGRIGDRHTAENLLNTYLTNLFILEDDEEYEDSYDIGSGEQTTTSLYVTGYLADLYLGELAARQIYADSSVKALSGTLVTTTISANREARGNSRNFPVGIGISGRNGRSYSVSRMWRVGRKRRCW